VSGRAPFRPAAVEPAPAQVLQLPRRGERRPRTFTPWRVDAPSKTDEGEGAEARDDPVEMARAEAERQGYAEGLERGRAEAEAQAAELLATMRRSVEDLARLRDTLWEVYRREAVELALMVAKAFVRKVAEDDRTVFEQWLDESLGALDPSDDLVIRCAEPQRETVEAWVAGLAEHGRTIEVAPDPNLDIGDLRVDCTGGSVEMILDRRIDRVRRLTIGRTEEASA